MSDNKFLKLLKKAISKPRETPGSQKQESEKVGGYSEKQTHQRKPEDASPTQSEKFPEESVFGVDNICVPRRGVKIVKTVAARNVSASR